MIDIFKEFLKRNPSKILGTQKETTDRFGKPDIKIVGELSEIDRIDVSDSILPDRNSKTVNISNNEPNLDTKLENVRKSLSKTAEDKERTNKRQAKTKTKKRKKKVYILDGDEEQELFKGEEAFEKLNGDKFSEDYLSVWAWYNFKHNKPINKYFDKFLKTPTKEWFSHNLSNGNLSYDTDSNDYVPSVLYYSGNIYHKLISLNNAVTDDIFTESQKLSQKKRLNNILPPRLKLTGKDDERLVIDVLSKFADETKIAEEGETIKEAFITYLSSLDSDGLKHSIRPYRIIRYYIRGDRFPNSTPAYEKADTKRLAALECVYQMSKFLSEELSISEQTKIEVLWNEANNNFVDINYNDIPLYFEFSKYFKESDFEIRTAQREGVAFNSINGTGIIAYDVGVGKTSESIINIANALQSGACNKPLFVVPKQTYDKWIGEIRGVYDENGVLIASGILPQYPIYDLFNLNKKISSEVIDEDGGLKNLPEKCILMATYQGMANIGFGQEESSKFMNELKEVLNQGFGNESEREKALNDEKLNKKIGLGLEGTVLNIENVGIDYLTIDEAHNMNKIFSNVKGEAKENGREKSNYQIKGSESARGIKAFFLSNYVQRNSKGNGNICLLTATPFTNSPLEVFNMLALTNIKRLSSLGLKNVVDFFDNYVNQTYEKVIKQNGEIVEAAVIKGWSNKVALQKILFSYMNYKSGEDANIQRPIKWTLPKLSEEIDGVRVPLALKDQTTTFLKPSNRQKEIQKEIGAWLVEQMKDQHLARKAPHLVADIKAKKNNISPYIYNGTAVEQITPKDFIESSPKLKYTMECIKSVIEWHKKDGSQISGQVIYINGGIDYLGLVKRYLIENIGYKKDIARNGKSKYFDEVEVLVGGGANTPKELKRNDDEKEDIKELFLNGTIKVIIGSSTIREGIDLQKKSTVLYNLWVDWNPTDYKQLEGRIWRFGNIYSNVRIVTPLVVGSSDAFTYQKLEEKTGRINDIFDRNDRSNILDIGSEDREEVKWALIDDLSEVAKAKIKDKISDLRKRKELVEGEIEFVSSINYTLEQQDNKTKKVEDTVQKYWKYVETEEDVIDSFDKMRLINRQQSKIGKKRAEEGYVIWREQSEIRTSFKYLNEIKKTAEKLVKIDQKLESEYNTSIYGETEPIIESLKAKREEIEQFIIIEQSDENLIELTEKLEAERKKFNSGIESFENTVNKFKDLNYLLGIFVGVNKTNSKSKSELINNLRVEEAEIVSETETKEESESDSIEEAIEALKLTLDFAPKNEIKEIKEAIEGLELLLILK